MPPPPLRLTAGQKLEVKPARMGILGAAAGHHRFRFVVSQFRRRGGHLLQGSLVAGGHDLPGVNGHDMPACTPEMALTHRAVAIPPLLRLLYTSAAVQSAGQPRRNAPLLRAPDRWLRLLREARKRVRTGNNAPLLLPFVAFIVGVHVGVRLLGVDAAIGDYVVQAPRKVAARAPLPPRQPSSFEPWPVWLQLRRPRCQ